jgi:excisionase family DNA binding protein
MGEKKQRELWTFDELCAYLKLSKSTVHLYIAEGFIPFVTVGRRKRFIPDDVEKAIRRGLR